jgi:hypothetical protein
VNAINGDLFDHKRARGSANAPFGGTTPNEF